MGLLDLIKTAEVITGLVVTFFGVVAGAFVWLNRRINSSVGDATSTIGVAQAANGQRLAHVEQQLGSLSQDVQRLDGRMLTAERKLERVAEAKDVAEVRASVAELTGVLRNQTGMIDTLYKAALHGSRSSEQ